MSKLKVAVQCNSLGTRYGIATYSERLNKYLNRGYESDIKKFGKMEHWMDATEILKYYFKSNNPGDCEDTSFFKFFVLKYAMQLYNFWNENKWRLQLIWVELIHKEHHVMLCWAKEGPNDWIPVELTLPALSLNSQYQSNT